MFIRISDTMLVAIAKAMAADGYVRKMGEKAAIVAKATSMYECPNGRAWKFPNKNDVRNVWLPAYTEAMANGTAPVVTPKAAKATAKATAAKATGKRVAGSPEAIAWGKEMAAARAAKRNGSKPASGSKAPAAKAPKAASGKLTQAQITMLAETAAQAAVKAILAAI